jgi:hypothetical protein
VLLVLDKQDHLQTITDDEDIDYSLSKSDQYTRLCGNSLEHRVGEYAGGQITYGGSTYDVTELLDDQDTADELLDEVIMDLLDNDSSSGRGTLRRVELVRLAATVD